MPGKCEHGLTTAECLVCASPKHGELADAYRCIAPACKPLGCSDCNCAVPTDVYAALGRAFQDAERERFVTMLEHAMELDGFGCACEPARKCGTCQARDTVKKALGPLLRTLKA